MKLRIQLYTFLNYLLAPFLIFYFYKSIKKGAEFHQRWKQGWAWYEKKIAYQSSIWLHAASLGEINAAIAVIDGLRKTHPTLPFIITTFTQTGAHRVRQLWGDDVIHFYAPLDYPGVVRRFIHYIQPRIAIIMETELWPQRLIICAELNIPIIIINARISPLSLQRYYAMKWFLQPILQNINKVLTQSAADSERFIQLGVPEHRIKMIGNCKFDIDLPNHVITDAKVVRQKWQLGQERIIWIAASTYHEEEQILLKVYAQLQQKFSQLMLVLVPRHIERSVSLYEQCQTLSLTVRLHSQIEQSTVKTDIIVGDTTGELMTMYGASDIAFVGGSLVPSIGGHNPIEPALLGLPILMGPHYENCIESVQALQIQEAISIIYDAETIKAQMTQWIDYPLKAKQIGQQAQLVVKNHRGASEKYTEEVNAYLSKMH